MLKLSLITVLCLFLLLLASCQNETAVIIRGEISNLDSPFILATHISADTFVVDTILVDNNRGRFTHKANIDTATVVTLYMNQFASSVVLFADKGQRITVRGDAQQPDFMQVSGNEVNNELTAFRNENRELLYERNQLVFNFEDFSENDSISWHTANRAWQRFFVINRELSLRAEEHIIENPTRLSSVILINEFFTDHENIHSLHRVLAYLEGEAMQTRLTRQLQNLSSRMRPLEQTHAPLFELISTENDTIRLRDNIQKYLLLSFLSTEGNESRRMVESLKKTYERLNDTVRFVSIYIDSDTFPVTYLASDSITWHVVAERNGWDSDIVNLLDIRYVPYNILISPGGIINGRAILPQRIVELIRPEEDEEEECDC